MLKINILSIAGIGLLMLLTGLLLFVFQDSIAQQRRFFLPIPPLGVAAYVFVFNLFQHHSGSLPESPWLTMMEVLSGTAIAGAVFLVFSLLLVAGINQLK
jgi:CHASE1-domain containing sensor protein